MPDSGASFQSDPLITIAVSLTSVLSALSCGFVLISYFRFPSLRRHPASLVVARCVADLLFCVGTFASHITPTAACEAWSFFSQLFAMAAELYTLTQAVDLVLSVSNPFGSYIKTLRAHHLFVWGASVLSAALLLGLRVSSSGRPFFGRDPFVGVCWIRRVEADEKVPLVSVLGSNVGVYFFFVAPLVLIYAASGAGLLVAMWRLSRGLHETLDSRVAVFRNTYRFILGFVLYWVLMFVAYGAVSATGKSSAAGVESERLSIVLALALGSRGLVTGLVWFATYGLDVVRLLCSCGRGTSVEDGLEELNRQPRLARELRMETLYYVTRGIVRASLHAARSPDVVDGRAQPRSAGKPAVAFNRFPLSRRHEERGLFSQQRRASATANAAEVALREDGLNEPLVNGINDNDGGGDSGVEGSYLRAIAGRPSMQSMTEEEEAAEELFMAGGSRGCCGGCCGGWGSRRAEADGDGEIFNSNTANLLYSLLFPSSYISAHFIFTDLEPHLFSRLRALNGVAEAEYARAIATATRERASEGASGAFLYFSSCDRFIMKTISHTEKDVLLDMMPHFEDHLKEHPNTLITRFLGCYALTMYGSTQYFCVMRNVLTSEGATVHERYDLKGSWIHRHHKPPLVGQRVACRYCGQDFRVGTRRSSNQCPLRPNHQHEPNTILLDNDWDYKLRLARPQARALVTTIIVDTEWLRDQGIMDYSLLLGIHRSRYNLMSLGGGDLAPSRSQADIGGGGVAAAVTAPAAPHVANDAPITLRSPTLPVPRRPASLKSDAAANCLEGLPSSLGSPLCVQSSLVSATQSSFSSLALSADSGGGNGGGGGGTPRSVECPGTATSLFSPLPLESVLSDELDSGAGPLFVEVGEAPRGGGAAAAPHAPPSLFHEHRGGMRAVVVEGPGVYYLGIVDVLQRWTFSKRFENWFKSRVRLYDASGLSAVPPRLYASRFKTRVLAQLIEGWDEERGRSGSVGNV